MFAQKYLNLGDLDVGSGGGFGDIDWQSVINQAFGVGSQAISAFSGAHGGVQVGANSSGGIFAITPTRPAYDETSAYLNPYANMTPAQVQAYQQAQQGGVAEDALGSIANFVSQHPIMVFGGIAAIFLLYREPPRRR